MTLEEENKRLKEILLAALPALRMADKCCSSLYGWPNTKEEFLDQREGYHKGEILNWKVRQEAYKILGVNNG